MNPIQSNEQSWGYDRTILNYIQNAAAHGLYEIRGLGAKRKLPHSGDGDGNFKFNRFCGVARP